MLEKLVRCSRWSALIPGRMEDEEQDCHLWRVPEIEIEIEARIREIMGHCRVIQRLLGSLGHPLGAVEGTLEGYCGGLLAFRTKFV